MRTVVRILAVVCCATPCLLAQSQDFGQAPDVPTLLARSSAYTTRYLTTMSGLLGEEHYRQESPAVKVVEAPPADGMRPYEYTIPGQRRELRSEILILKLDTLLGWRVFRDVFEVDGRSIRDRKTRLGQLFLEPAATAAAQAQRIDQEGTRFNISDVGRTLNLPGLPMLFLQESIRPRFKFDLENVVVETGTVWVLAFQETTRPTIFRHNVRSDNVSTGRIWMTTAGVVLRTEHVLKPFRVNLTYDTEFAPSPEFGVALPTKMSERIGGDRKVQGDATYPVFRRFAVLTQEQLVAPVP